MQISRRNILGLGAAGTLAFSGLTKAVAVETHRASYYNEVEGYGPLREDTARIIDLPVGFSYRIISQAGETMDDGLLVPHVFDGMGCFPGKGDEIILVRNHELLPEHRDFGSLGVNGRLLERLDKTKVYDFEDSGLPLGGGTTTVVYDLKKNKVIRQHQSLIGTTTNCAGGTTPWGSWLSCEETVMRKGQGVGKDHGYVFEVPSNSRRLIDPLPIRAMGRFKHEAACIDPRTGIVYMTEDVEDGLFYRYLPDDRSDLKKGGRLEAMGLKAHPQGCDTSNRKDALWRTGERFEVVWIPLDDVENANDDLRCRGFKAGAAKVCRGEGIHFGTNEVFICATAGGAVGSGQILRYTPSPHEGQVNEKDHPGSLSLFLESINEKVFDYGDNLTVSPWGHLFVCEDRYSDTLQNHLRIVTPEAKVATFARNVFKGNGEWAGACFSPDGSTLFVNVQWPGFTVAITGPWASFKARAAS